MGKLGQRIRANGDQDATAAGAPTATAKRWPPSNARGDELLASIRTATEVLVEVREQLVFIGGCAMALYARDAGAPLRAASTGLSRRRSVCEACSTRTNQATRTPITLLS